MSLLQERYPFPPGKKHIVEKCIQCGMFPFLIKKKNPLPYRSMFKCLYEYGEML